MALGAVALLLHQRLAHEITGLSLTAVRALGSLCLLLVLTYCGLAAFARLPLRIGRWTLRMPPLRLALAQIAVGGLNFALVAACLHATLAAVGGVAYPTVVTTYVIANAAAIVSHVPGGLGVLESVVLFLLPKAQFVAALVMFRVVYFLVPLSIGLTAFLVTEAAFRRRGRDSRRGALGQTTRDR
jgi:uncharacterized membrane protein YbhN (UPF0104 family)